MAKPSPSGDRALWRDHLRNLPQYLLPQRLLTRLVYRLTRTQSPWLRDRLIRAFIKNFNVDLSEAEHSDPLAYSDFNRFFTRALRPEARPIAAGEKVLACPVDGSVSQAGRIDDDTVFQAKGHSYSLTTLLGGDAARARPFRNGQFATLYLSPRDYHRIHMPLQGVLREMVHIPGRLFSVSPLTTRMIPGLFARNERVVTIFDTSAGPMALVLVGAINVASIETVWAGTITPPLATRLVQQAYPAQGGAAIVLDKGAEMGRFNMGSTVIVLFGEHAVRWDAALQPAATVRMGQRLGERLAARAASPTHRLTIVK